MKYKVLTMNNFYKDIAFPSRDIYGIYHSSDWSPIPGYNNKVFMIVFNLDYRLYSPVDYLDCHEYAKGCIHSLNNVPKNKRDKSPIFGQLTYFKSRVLTHKTGNKYIQVFALTNEKKNKAIFRLGDAVEAVPSVKEYKERRAAIKEAAKESGDDYINKVEKILDAAPKKRGRPKKTDEQKAVDAKKKQMIKDMKKRGRPAKTKKEK